MAIRKPKPRTAIQWLIMRPLTVFVVYLWWSVCFAEAMGNTFSTGKTKEQPDTFQQLYPPHLKLCMLQVIHRHGHRTPVAAESIVPWFPNGWPLCTAGESTRHALLVSRERSNHPEQELHPPHLESEPAVRYFDLKFEHPHTQADSPHATEQFFKRVVRAAKSARNALSSAATVEQPKGICYHGQLTDEGRSTLTQLGSRLRKLYTDRLQFLPAEYNPTECYFRSTDYARTIESLQSLIVGLFPSVSDLYKSNISINIRKDHNETMYDTMLCKWLRRFSTDFLAQFRQENQSWIKQLQERHVKFSKTGRPEDIELTALWDFFAAYSQHGFKIPCNVTPRDYEELRDFAYKHEYGYFYRDPSILKYVIGKFLNELKQPMKQFIDLESTRKQTVDLFNISQDADSPATNSNESVQKSNQSENAKKLYVYSGHDSTIVPVLSALGAMNEHAQWPPFASNIIVELLKDTRQVKDSYHVRIKFQEQPITIPECRAYANGEDTSLCPAEEFFKIIDKYYPHDYAERCYQ